MKEKTKMRLLTALTVANLGLFAMQSMPALAASIDFFEAKYDYGFRSAVKDVVEKSCTLSYDGRNLDCR